MTTQTATEPLTFSIRMAPGDSLELVKAAPERLTDTALIHHGSRFVGLLGKGQSGAYYIWLKASDSLITTDRAGIGRVLGC